MGRPLQIYSSMISIAETNQQTTGQTQKRLPSRYHIKNIPTSTEAQNGNFSVFVVKQRIARMTKLQEPNLNLQNLTLVVNDLKIVEGKDKLRTCINPMYINRFMSKDPVRYERLLDLKDMVEPEDYLTTSDDKSGYWQLPLHPSVWKYVDFEFEGQVYCFLMLPFGVMYMSACYTYTTIKQEVYRPLRQMGVRMSMLLDDRAACESSRPRARLQLEGLNKVLIAIGPILSAPDKDGRKAQWLPSRQCRFLGFVIDAESQRFVLPEEKKQDLIREVDSVLKV